MVGTDAAAPPGLASSPTEASACSTTMPLSATRTDVPPGIESTCSGTPAVSITNRQAGANSSGGSTQSSASSCALNSNRNESSTTRAPRVSIPRMPLPFRNIPIERPKPASQSSGFIS